MESKRSKYILIGLSVFCILLIGISSVNDGFLSPLRNGVGYVLTPIQSGINRAGSAAYEKIRNYSNLQDALAENEELKSRVASLTEENNRLQLEQFELDRLRELYGLDQEYMQYQKVGARVIAKDSGDWFQIFRIDKGARDGIRKDMNVIAGGGLVGIVTDVGDNYATVRSIIDDSSQVYAMAMQSGTNCVVEGDLTLYREGRLRLTHIPQDGDVKEGDRIVTSNISSVFLPGLLIGYAADISVDSSRVTQSGYLVPVAQFDTLQEVLVITDLKSEMSEGGEESQLGGETQPDGSPAADGVSSQPDGGETAADGEEETSEAAQSSPEETGEVAG